MVVKISLREETVETRYCDICDIPDSMGRKIRTCRICERDVCFLHRHDEENNTDYPDRYCLSCWSIGAPYCEKLERLETEYEKDRTTLENEWCREARETVDKMV